MKQYVKYIFLSFSFIVTFFLGCEEVVPVKDNILDPTNPDYEYSSLSGKISEKSNGDFISNALIILENIGTTTSDSDGYYFFSELIHGNYVITTSKDSFLTRKDTITVEPNENLSYGISLAREIPPSITVISPDGGEDWQIGSTQLITWTSSDVTGDVLIELQSSGNTVNVIASTSNDGNYSWEIPSSLNAGSNYTVKIISSSDDSVNDESDAVFTISSASIPSITVISPNGGEDWQIGSTNNITWSSNDVTGSVYIALLKNGYYADGVDISSTATDNDGFHTWTIPPSIYTGAGSDYKVKIISTLDYSVYDESDEVFTISPETVSSGLTMLYPNGGETWEAGASNRVIVILPENNVGETYKLAIYKEDGNTPWGQELWTQSITPTTAGFEHVIFITGYSTAFPPDDDYKMKIYQDGAENEIFDFSDDYFIWNHENTACDQVDYNSGSFSNYDHYYWYWNRIDQDDFMVDIVDSKLEISCNVDDGYYHGIMRHVASDFSSTCTYLEPTSNDEVIIKARAQYVGNNGNTAQFALAFDSKYTWVGNSGYSDRWLFEFYPESSEYRFRFYDNQADEMQTVINWTEISSTIWNSQPGTSNEISIKLNYNNDTEVFVNGSLLFTYDNSANNGAAPSVGEFFIWCAKSTMLFDNIELTGPGNDDDNPTNRVNNSFFNDPLSNQLIPLD